MVYAAFNTQLQIKGEAVVRSDQEIRITDFRLIETTNNAFEIYNSKYEKNTTSLFVSLPPSSSMTYELTITNKNSVLMYRIEELLTLNNNNPNVTIEYGVNVGNVINNSKSRKFTITLKNDTSNEQSLTLINQYKFAVANWGSLETQFLSESDFGDLSVNKNGVLFEFSVSNLNTFPVNYKLTSNNGRFTIVDENTNNKTFSIEPNQTITHKVRVKLRDDVTYENVTENLKLMLRTTSPVVNNVDVKTVTLKLPQYFKTVILNSMKVLDSPKNFTALEDTNGYLYRINELNSSSYTYYYRGVINNNYVSFAGYLWRVVRVDSNGNIRVVLNDNVQNTSKFSSKYFTGNVQNLEDATSLIDYKNSDVKNNVEAWYSQNIANKTESIFVMDSNFCIDKSYHGPFNTQYGHTVYYFTPYLHVGIDSNSFSPDFTCSNENAYKSKVGLLSAEEVLAAGGFWQKLNKKYYLYNQDVTGSQTSWTISGSYFSENEKQVGVIVYNQNDDESGVNVGLFDWVQGGNLTQDYGYRPVISLNGNVKVSGDGTKENPYKLYDLTKNIE